ncbi:Mediator of RNA polymerase II transcription subunit 12 [Wickerhamiella sorbophila]|uniref:Mediator of RNA polymerase II transcription subunit 12 n=1 Tax=Wickerhamiella sorbophila TaxID=45607 RepID=A0A2T0FG72_9ASCO|nr:Mediator of RNA polymerase II transcription subunit 12 [Wickerhamiella sorbophila]PRT53991.1 Mediator of RNA polymerase II transcription subunit 12 [Wickerhamiella sorbophila]
MTRQGPSNIFPYPGKAKKIYPDYFPWNANDSIPPTTDEIQKGLAPHSVIKNEYASCGGPNSMVPLLKHWTALPAISYFLTSSMHVREASRRIHTPSTFKPPPRVILTDQKRELWLRDLSNPKVSLRKLARTIPHGISGGKLLDEIFRHRVPVLRALWFIRCVGANDFRTIKRKAGPTSSVAGVEDTWMRSWTQEVLDHLEATIELYDPEDFREWQLKISYLARLLANMFYEELLHRQTLLDWLLTALASGPNQWLPVVLLLVSVFWLPLTQPALVQRLVRSFVARYEQLSDVRGVQGPLNNQFVRLFKSRPEAFIMPEHWPSIARYLTQVVAPSSVQAIAKRNARFTIQTPVDVPPAWATTISIASSLDTFGLPYPVSHLCHELRTRVSSSELAEAVFQWTLRRGGSRALVLCIAICRHLRSGGANLQEVFINELLASAGEYSETVVINLITECYRARVFTFEVYFRRLMGSGALYRDSASRQWHHKILNNLPFSLMPRHLHSQSRMLLRKHSHPNDRDIVRPLVEAVADRLDTTLPPLVLSDLTKNQQILFCQGVFEAAAARTPPTLDQLKLAVSAVAPHCIMGVYKLARLAWRTTKSAEVAKYCIFLFKQNLFECVCLGVLDNLVEGVLDVLKEPHIAHLDIAELLSFLQCLRDVSTHSYALQRLDNNIRLFDEQDSTLSPEETQPLSLEAQVSQAMDRKDVALLAELREHDETLVQTLIPKWIAQVRNDRLLLIKCVIYGCVTYSELDEALNYDDDTMFFLALKPAVRMNLLADELERVYHCRKLYYSTAPKERLLRLQERYPIDEVAQMQRTLSMYPALSLTRLPSDLIAELPIKYPNLVKLYSKGVAFDLAGGTVVERFIKTVQASNPFTFHFCRSALAIVFAGLSAKEIAQVVLDAIRDGTDLAPCASSLFNQFSAEVKAELLAACEQEFLTAPLQRNSLPSLATIVDSVALYARETPQSPPPDVSDCIAAVVDMASAADAVVDDVLRAISLLVKLTLIHTRDASLDYAVSQCKVVAGLIELNHLPLICASVEASQLVSDALYILQTDHSTVLKFSDTMQETAPLEGLMMYSRSSDIYTPLNVWPFDLIEDANPTIGMNDLALDLARFETYIEIKDPS